MNINRIGNVMGMTLRLSQSRIFSHSASRFLLPVVIVVVLRILCATLLYTFLSPAVAVRSTLHNAFYIFAAWDSEHYIFIAQSWYPSTPAFEWAFFPLYPAVVRCLSVFGLDVALGALIVATASGLISVVVFQKIADFYLPRDRALVATLVYFMLPPVFVLCGDLLRTSILVVLPAVLVFLYSWKTLEEQLSREHDQSSSSLWSTNSRTYCVGISQTS